LDGNYDTLDMFLPLQKQRQKITKGQLVHDSQGGAGMKHYN